MNSQLYIKLQMLEEAIEDVEYKKYKEEMRQFQRQNITESTKYELNFICHSFEKYLKNNYLEYNESKCNVMGELGYYETEWTVKDLCEMYRKYCPERYNGQEEYTRLEVNSMLFDLELKDVIGGYKPVAVPCLSSYNDRVFTGLITVLVRYFI